MIGFDSSGPLAGDCWQNRRPTPLIPANSPPAARCSRLTGMADSSQSSSKNDNNNGVVIDELLCFVQNKIDLLPPTAIADLCTATFQDGDIEASKRRLFELCADENCTRLRKRQGPHKTTKNIDDIVRLMQEKGTDTPTFVALNLPLQKSVNGIPFNTIQYHSIPFITIEAFNGILVGLNGSLNGIWKYH